jgi:hypothetical protein
VDEPRRTNDNTRLVPRTEFSDGRVLEFAFRGLEIGVAEYEEGADRLQGLRSRLQGEYLDRRARRIARRERGTP